MKSIYIEYFILGMITALGYLLVENYIYALTENVYHDGFTEGVKQSRRPGTNITNFPVKKEVEKTDTE